MFSPDHLNFHFPLFTTCLHMLVQFSLAALVLYFVPRFRPRHDSLSRPHGAISTSSTADTIEHPPPPSSDKPLMTKRFYITRIGPCAAATGLDIGLGNMSLKFITLTFYSTYCISYPSSLPILPLSLPSFPNHFTLPSTTANVCRANLIDNIKKQCVNPPPSPSSYSSPFYSDSNPPPSNSFSSSSR